MSINLSKKQFALTVVAAVMVMVCSFVLGTHGAEPVIEEVVKYVEIIPENNFLISFDRLFAAPNICAISSLY